MGISRRSAYINFLDCHGRVEVTREELEELNHMERSLVGRWNDVLCLIKDDRNVIRTDDHNLVSALGMAVGYTQRNTERFTREAFGAERTPVVSQTGPDDETGKVRDAAVLELACVRTWVDEEETRESVRETKRFPQDGEAMTELGVHGKEVDIRTVTVTSAEGRPRSM